MKVVRTMKDLILEYRIRKAQCALVSARSREERLAAWRHMADLIRSRSPERIARMERERGLA